MLNGRRAVQRSTGNSETTPSAYLTLLETLFSRASVFQPGRPISTNDLQKPQAYRTTAWLHLQGLSEAGMAAGLGLPGVLGGGLSLHRAGQAFRARFAHAADCMYRYLHRREVDASG